MNNIPKQIQEKIERLPVGLQSHLTRVSLIAHDLSVKHQVDSHKAQFAAICHDLARDLEPKILIKEAERLFIPIGTIEKKAPILLHGPIAATWLSDEIGIQDKEILQAVYSHSTGCKNMTKLSKIVFIADKVDEIKLIGKPHLVKIKDLAYQNLDQAILEYFNHELKVFLERGDYIHPSTIEARNELLESLESEV